MGRGLHPNVTLTGVHVMITPPIMLYFLILNRFPWGEDPTCRGSGKLGTTLFWQKDCLR